ncbi:MAG: NAD-dependent epimerase/dehydratase family protein [Cellulosilyticaceae bacterium]
MSRFVVTGATGFVGSALCKKLVAANHEVHIICRKESSLEALSEVLEEIRVMRYDADSQGLIRYFQDHALEGVFHLAASCITEHQPQDIQELVDSNIKFGVQILEAMRVTGVRYIVNTGTSWQHYQNEAYNPVCLYAATKQAFQDILFYYHRAYGLKAINLELFDTYGERDTRRKLIPELIRVARSQEKILLSEGNQKMDLVHVEDVVSAYLRAWELLQDEEFEGYETYGVATGRLVSVRELVGLVQKITHCQMNVSFGEKPYRLREMMAPWNGYKVLPDWESHIALEKGIRRIVKQLSLERGE